MPKRDIRMTEVEVAAFLETRTLATVVAGAEDQAPHAALADFRYRDGAASFTVPLGSQVAQALADDDRACCIIDQRPFEAAESSYYDTKSVMLHGRARQVDGGPPGMAAFELAVEKIVSFDFAKLRTEA